MESALIIPLLTAFGAGSVVTALIQAFLTQISKKSERSFAEKKEAYVGLLKAYHEAAVNPSEESSKNFAFWQMRCELVAPKAVRLAIENIITTNDNRDARYKAHEELKDRLRKDLGVIRR